MDIKEGIGRLLQSRDLSESEMTAIMTDLMEGKLTDAQIGGFLIALRLKGENSEEITAAAKVMRDKATLIPIPKGKIAVDVCGTGGDHSGTFNISTCVSFILAAADIVTAKHGNKGVSSKCGSADVLEALGINIGLEPDVMAKQLEAINISFLYAVKLHPAMKHAIGPRRELGQRTIFNVLGPLTNPARVKRQVIGVYDRALVKPIAKVLKNLGHEKALVVHGEDGLDELTTTAKTYMVFLTDGELQEMDFSPESVGLPLGNRDDLVGGNAQVNAAIVLDILEGKTGPKRDIVLLNAAAALKVVDKVTNFKDGIQMAAELIDSRNALSVLEKWRSYA